MDERGERSRDEPAKFVSGSAIFHQFYPHSANFPPFSSSNGGKSSFFLLLLLGGFNCESFLYSGRRRRREEEVSPISILAPPA